jgi:hypothetical protein
LAWETRLYPLFRGGPKRVTVKWRDKWQDFSVYLDGQLLIPDRNGGTLNAGLQFTLPDGFSISVWLEGNTLHVARDGMPLPGSHDDRVPRLYVAAAVIILNALLTFGSGLLLLTSPSQLGIGPISGAINIFFSLVYAILAYNTLDLMRGALWIAVILYGIESLLSLIVAISGVPILFICLPARLLFFVLIYRGFVGIEARDVEMVAEHKHRFQPATFSINLLEVGQRIIVAGFVLEIFLCVLMTSGPSLFGNMVLTPIRKAGVVLFPTPTITLRPSRTPLPPTITPLFRLSGTNMSTRSTASIVFPKLGETDLQGRLQGQIHVLDSSRQIQNMIDINEFAVLAWSSQHIRIRIRNWVFEFHGPNLRSGVLYNQASNNTSASSVSIATAYSPCKKQNGEFQIYQHGEVTTIYFVRSCEDNEGKIFQGEVTFTLASSDKALMSTPPKSVTPTN